MFSWLMAKYYDYMLQDAEKKCLQDWRKTLLQDLSGDVIEVGAGTGANLAFYPKTIKHLVLAEPDPHMRHQLDLKLNTYPHLPVSVQDYAAETLPVASECFDAVICTLLLCSVKNPSVALAEMHRVLRPGGRLLFIEHVAAQNNPERLKWQHRLEPFWKIVQCGCHLTRDTETSILQAGFQIQQINRLSMRGVPAVARPAIWGCTIKL